MYRQSVAFDGIHQDVVSPEGDPVGTFGVVAPGAPVVANGIGIFGPLARLAVLLVADRGDPDESSASNGREPQDEGA